MKIKAIVRSESDAERLRDEARSLRKTADRLDAMAAECYFQSNNKPDWKSRFDLHGYHVTQAEQFVLAKLKAWLSGALGNLPKLTFVLGKGNHSPHGMAKLLPAIETLFRESRPELIAEVREGEIIISKDESNGRDNLVDLRAKLRTLPFELTATEDYPCYLHDKIAVEAYEVFRHLAAQCEEFLVENWKGDADTTVRAIELLGKFGIKKPLEHLLVNGHLQYPHIGDDNVAELMELCKQHSLDKIMSDCERYINENWKSKPEKALHAVELADKINLPNLANKFIPLAACCPLAEINSFRQYISVEHFDQIVVAFYRQRITDANIETCAANPRLNVHAEAFLLANWNCSEKVAKAVELCAKYSLDACLAKLFRDDKMGQCNIMDENVVQLLSVCNTYPQKLAELQANCVQHISQSWPAKPEKALTAVLLGHDMHLPGLAETFIPLAAARLADQTGLPANAEVFRHVLTAKFNPVAERGAREDNPRVAVTNQGRSFAKGCIQGAVGLMSAQDNNA